MRRLSSLCMVRKSDAILLGMKKRGFGKGWWNGFGGKVLKNETMERAVQRELFEECLISATVFHKRGVLNYIFSQSNIELEIHVFLVDDFLGEPQETQEMRPKWFSITNIPYQAMWPSDKLWLPLFLQNKKFIGTFYQDDNETIVSHTITQVDKLSK